MDSRIALTFGDAGENHVDNQMVGNLGDLGSGFKIKHLKQLKTYFESIGKTVELLDLGRKEDVYDKKKHEGKIAKMFVKEKEGKIVSKAAVLVVRNYLDDQEAHDLYDALTNEDWDKKYWDKRRGKVLNKHARTNIIILDGVEQEPDYPNGKGRIIDSNKIMNNQQVPVFKNVKQRMITQINENCVPGRTVTLADNLICEGNHYYEPKKCGIGFHGDAERRKVVCLSLGVSTTIKWVWYKKSKPEDEYEIQLNNGDMYIMSEKAVGYDWRKFPSLWTLRHAAGCPKYTTVKGKP